MILVEIACYCGEVGTLTTVVMKYMRLILAHSNGRARGGQRIIFPLSFLLAQKHIPMVIQYRGIPTARWHMLNQPINCFRKAAHFIGPAMVQKPPGYLM